MKSARQLSRAIHQFVRNKSSGPAEFPDYKTDVNIHLHKLSKPKKRPLKWKEIQEMDATLKGSLIPQTLEGLDNDEEFKETQENLKKYGQKALTREERRNRQRSLDKLGVPNFVQFWKEKRAECGRPVEADKLQRGPVSILQLNIGLYCNQACNHCHVESSPRRKEMMNKETADRVLTVLRNSPSVQTVDLTGGAPELNEQCRYLVQMSREEGKEVIVRTNLTALMEPGQEDTAAFLAENGARVIASLPCYTEQNVTIQRGLNAFNRSIQGLRLLNSLGYGQPDSNLVLDLAYNPLGNYLPPPQAELEEQYKKELSDNFGIEFNSLFTLTNIPVKRFADFLYRRGELEEYMSLLVRNFNVDSVDNIMCGNTLSVNWKGELFDCDINNQLEMYLNKEGELEPEKQLTIWDIDNLDTLKGNAIVTDNHCYGCTARMGSSCQGTVI